jgi:MoxR-like ATPase
MDLSEALAGVALATSTVGAMKPLDEFVANALGLSTTDVYSIRLTRPGNLRKQATQSDRPLKASIVVAVVPSAELAKKIKNAATKVLGLDRKDAILALYVPAGTSTPKGWTVYEPESGTVAQRLQQVVENVTRTVVVPPNQLPLDDEDDDEDVEDPEDDAERDSADGTPPVTVLPAGHVPLVIDERIRRMLRLAIASSRAVMLIGPPGTGKTTLLLEAFQEAQEDPGSYGLAKAPEDVPLVVTPEEGWTSRELVGGETVDDQANLRFKPGYVLDAVKKNTWLILDEANRADMDRIFGGLLTFLSGRAVTLGRAAGTSDAATIRLEPSSESGNEVVNEQGLVDGTGEAIVYRAGGDWKLLGTYNALDAHRVFRFGQALGRRFARVPVPAVDPEQFSAALDPSMSNLVEAHPDVDAARVRDVVEGLYAAHLEMLQPVVGPALFLAVPGYVASGLSLGGDVGLEQLLVEGYLLGAGPLLAQLEPKTLETFKARVVSTEQLIGEGQWTFLESLLSTLT